MKKTKKISSLGKILLTSMIVGGIIGSNIGSSLAAKKNLNSLEDSKQKTELAKYIKQKYMNKGVIYKTLNFGSYVSATNAHLNNL